MADPKAEAHKRELMNNPAYDPTDNIAPYGDCSYVRAEFVPLRDTKANTIAATYQAGKASTLVYDAVISEDGLKCAHLIGTLTNPASCAYCNHDALKKYTYHRIYDDHIETNIPASCCCWIVENTQVFYLDRDWAQNFEVATSCTPCFTHCGRADDCCGFFGKIVIGYGQTNGVCCAGGRRIATSYDPKARYGGPLFFGWCPVGNAQWVFFPFINGDKTDEFVEKLIAQRSQIKAQFNIEVGKAGLAAKTADGQQSRE